MQWWSRAVRATGEDSGDEDDDDDGDDDVSDVGNRCSDGHELSVPPVKTLVMVVDAERPTITLRGIASQAADVYDLSHGTHLFPDLVIDATTKTEHNELNSDSVCSCLGLYIMTFH